MIKVIDLAEKYKDAPDTDGEIISYLQKNDPTGPYQKVIRTFQNGEGKSDDVEFYEWLKENYQSVKVLSPLKKLDDFEDFIFRFGNVEKPIYNQKWHFYVSYLAYKEYWTVTNQTNKEMFKIVDGEWCLSKLSFKCNELNIWLENAIL